VRYLLDSTLLIDHGNGDDSAARLLRRLARSAQFSTGVDIHRAWMANRFLLIGYSARERVLVVVTSERGPRPRIISARRATKRE